MSLLPQTYKCSDINTNENSHECNLCNELNLSDRGFYLMTDCGAVTSFVTLSFPSHTCEFDVL